MKEPEYLVGIDLGTSNSALAFVELREGAQAAVHDFGIPQLIRPGESALRPLLPSCIYLTGPHELAPEASRLPWGGASDWVAGEFARWQGARVPGRLVSSAKSWLCHSGVERGAPILPWGSPPDVKKISPVEASAHVLEHLVAAWNFAHPQAPLAEQEVVLTVPASFDEAARALTVAAARQAGLERFTLLEEPQAAFYDFTARHRDDLESALEGIRLVLVVDVGGGTTDFTLVQTGMSPAGPLLRRIAVGEHLMLGGDNMDAALSRRLEERMTTSAKKLSATQWSQLTQAARVAKEALLGPDGSDHYNLSIASEGSRLIGGSLSARLTRAETEQVVLDGFLPPCRPQDEVERGARVALQELGLPYAQDPAITRHLAAFLRAHAKLAFTALRGADSESVSSGAALPELGSVTCSGSQGREPQFHALPRPDALLLNGGVFNSPKIAARLVEVVSAWWPEAPAIPLLEHSSLELAVARGAAYYGLARRGLGRRIGGGAAHALYVGLEKTGSQEALALCVIPRGQEEGQTVELAGCRFHLALGRPVRFPVFSTASDRLEKSGEVVPVSDELQPLPPIHTLLKDKSGMTGNVPVHLRATLTEIGTLELWCVAEASKERWRLEFELRGAEASSSFTVTESMPAAFADARKQVEAIFAGKRAAGGGQRSAADREVKQLWTVLERTLGPREEWRLPVLRELWSVLFAGAKKRRRSTEHERIFFQLLGYTLRPGFGYPLDEWRCEQTAHLFGEGLQFQNDKPVWKEFWVLWRRIAGGLSEARQQEVWQLLKPWLASQVPPPASKHLPRPKGAALQDLDEMARLAASLEHLEPAQKVEFGQWIVQRLREPSLASGPWTWALGRLGARVPIYGSVHKTVPPERAAEWCRLLLEPRMISVGGVLFALAQLARLTGDRARDLDEDTRARVLSALRQSDASPTWQRMVSEVVVLEAADRARALGDTLPVGLILP
ncbi:Heat shock protein 70 family protein [Verrucomicrobia bacterium]|nr:Heat shock protein 70 family protein [Verrucomicrobiota bacterium]